MLWCNWEFHETDYPGVITKEIDLAKREIAMRHELSIVSRMCYNNNKNFSKDRYKYNKPTTRVSSSKVALLSGSWPINIQDSLEMKDRLRQRGGLWIPNELWGVWSYRRPKSVIHELFTSIASWWSAKRLLLVMELGSMEAITWEIFKNEFADRYFSALVKHNKLKDFANLVQSSMTVE